MSFDASQYVKSEWLHGSDLPQGQPVPVTIKSAYEHEFEQTGEKRPVLTFYEKAEKLTLNKTQTREMIALFGPNAGAWVGQAIEMLAVPSNYQGKPTISIRRGTPQGPPTMHYDGPAQQAPNWQQAPQNGQQQAAPEVNFR